jgi:hypothetical protein
VPDLRGSGSSGEQGQWHLVALPPGTGDVGVRNEFGDTVLSVRSGEGSHLLIFDTEVSGSQTSPENLVNRTWDVLTADGTVVGHITVHSPPRGTAPTDVMEVLTCLEQQGLHLGFDILPGPGPVPTADTTLDVQPYPPEVASSAWRQCRNVMIEALEDLGTPDAQIAASMALYDCMAELGWIQAFTGAETDVEARGDAVESCGAN